jgi:hypothetical protein
MSPASFAPIQRFNQILDKRGQPDGVSFVCNLNAKFTPVFLHTVSHIHLGRSEGCLRTLKSMRACRVPWLSGVLPSLLRGFPHSFHRRFRQFLGTGFTVSTASNRLGAGELCLGKFTSPLPKTIWIRIFCNFLSSEDADITEQGPLLRFDKVVSESRSTRTTITFPSSLSLSVMVAAQPGQSQKYSLVGADRLSMKSSSRRNSLPSVK